MALPMISMGRYDIFSMIGEMKVSSLFEITSQLTKHLEVCGDQNLVLDLSGTSFMDSSAIRLLINLKKRLDAGNREFLLLKPSGPVSNMLEETNLSKQFSTIASNEDLEKLVSDDMFDTFKPFSFEEGDQFRLSAMCPVCGSDDVSGYLCNFNHYDWRWESGDPFPTSYIKGTNDYFDAFSLQPIVCNSCFMASCVPELFHYTREGQIAYRSKLEENSKMLLSKSIKKRKSMMDLDVSVGDAFFNHPRERLVCRQAFLLSEACIRAVAVNKKSSDPFTIGYLNYLVLRYAEDENKSEYINNCRTWLSQALSRKDDYNHTQLAKIYHILLVAAINLEKMKEASELYNTFKAMIEELPENSYSHSIESPRFWFEQADNFWKNEIQNRSTALKI